LPHLFFFQQVSFDWILMSLCLALFLQVLWCLWQGLWSEQLFFFSAGGAALVGLGGSFFLSSLEESLEESVFFSGAFLSSTVFDSALGSGFFSGCFCGALSDSEEDNESLSFTFLSLEALGSLFLSGVSLFPEEEDGFVLEPLG